LANLAQLACRKSRSLSNRDFTDKRDRYFAQRAENLPNSAGVLRLASFKPTDMEAHHPELLDKLASSYAVVSCGHLRVQTGAGRIVLSGLTFLRLG
jgi:hypothetical protein